MDTRPNILFLFGDQHLYDCLGCAGNELIETPHLDALAARGIRFDAAYSNAPVCTPYRATLFSGRYGSQIGALDNHAALPTDRPRLAESLQEAGYRTSYVGKWHLGGTGQAPIPVELQGGFQDFIGYQCYNDFLHNVVFHDRDGMPRRFQKHRTEATADLAIERLQGLAAGADPFALFVSWQNPHYPLEPNPAWAARYAGLAIPPRPNQQSGMDLFTPTWSPRSARPVEHDPNYQRYGGDMLRYQQLYYAMVSQLDEQVGRVLAWLRILGLEENTIVVFTADHGDCQGAHGACNKNLWWEESARVPQLMQVPGGTGGQVIGTPVANVDFYPTFCDYAGLATPDHCVGSSLRPLIEGTGPGPTVVFSEMRHWCMLREAGWKLVYDRERERCSHLFDLTEDPWEQRDLIDDPSHSTRRADLARRLGDWDRSVRASAPA
ncbi:MAG: sulfatase-like hydrolase/transferase [Planctomycetota bacterium]